MKRGPDLDGFTQFPFAHDGIAHLVYRTGAHGTPPVLILQEMPGFAPGLIQFAERLAAAGFQPHLPWLFGPFRKRRPVSNFVRLCISREFAGLAAGETAPVTRWLRALVTRISRDNGDAHVAAIGMCITGAFAIPLLLHPKVQAAVAAQPAIPLPFTPTRAGALNVGATDIAQARAKLEAAQARLLAVRCVADRLCPRAKLARLEREFPVGLTVREYGTAQTRNGLGERPHAIYTKEMRVAPADDEAHYARQAFADLLRFLRAAAP